MSEAEPRVDYLRVPRLGLVPGYAEPDNWLFGPQAHVVVCEQGTIIQCLEKTFYTTLVMHAMTYINNSVESPGSQCAVDREMFNSHNSFQISRLLHELRCITCV